MLDWFALAIRKDQAQEQSGCTFLFLYNSQKNDYLHLKLDLSNYNNVSF